MSLWSQYIKECALLEIIENEFSWATFHIEPNDCLWINDMYVAPEKRRSGEAKKLLDQIFAWGRDRDCMYCYATIHTSSKSATEAIAAAIALGFRIVPSSNKDLILIGAVI